MDPMTALAAAQAGGQILQNVPVLTNQLSTAVGSIQGLFNMFRPSQPAATRPAQQAVRNVVQNRVMPRGPVYATPPKQSKTSFFDAFEDKNTLLLLGAAAVGAVILLRK